MGPATARLRYAADGAGAVVRVGCLLKPHCARCGIRDQKCSRVVESNPSEALLIISVHDTLLHHEKNLFGLADVNRWIAGYRNDVG